MRGGCKGLLGPELRSEAVGDNLDWAHTHQRTHARTSRPHCPTALLPCGDTSQAVPLLPFPITKAKMIQTKQISSCVLEGMLDMDVLMDGVAHHADMSAKAEDRSTPAPHNEFLFPNRTTSY